MSISINEFKANIEQYLLLAKTEDLFIRLDGDVVMRLSNTKSDRRKIAEQLNSYRITTSPSKAWWLSLFKKITAAALDSDGKLWYNTYSNRAMCLLSEQTK